MKNAGERGFRKGTRKTGLSRFYYRREFREDEVVECIEMKELEPTAVEMLRQKLVKDVVMRLEAVQQAATSTPHRRVMYYDRREIEGIREKELAAVAVVVNEAALESRKEWARERSSGCRCSVAWYIERVLGL